MCASQAEPGSRIMEALAKVLQDTELGAAKYVDKGLDVDGLRVVGLWVRDVEIGTGKGDTILSASQSAAANMLKQLEAEAPALAVPEEDAPAPSAPAADPLPSPALAADPPRAVEPLAPEVQQVTQAGDDKLGMVPELAAGLGEQPLGEHAPADPCAEAAAAPPNTKPPAAASKRPQPAKASRELSNLLAAFDVGSLVGTTAVERPAAATASKLLAEAVVVAASSRPQVAAAKRGPVRAAVYAQGATVLLRLTVGPQSRLAPWEQQADGKLREGARPDVGRDVWEVDRLLEKRRCKGGRVEYLVKWRGWEDRFNSWEPSRPVLSSEWVSE